MDKVNGKNPLDCQPQGDSNSKYDTIKDPPAPTIEVTIFNPIPGNKVQYYGILDTGTDDTVTPSNLIAELGLQKVRKKITSMST